MAHGLGGLRNLRGTRRKALKRDALPGFATRTPLRPLPPAELCCFSPVLLTGPARVAAGPQRFEHVRRRRRLDRDGRLRLGERQDDCVALEMKLLAGFGLAVKAVADHGTPGM